METSLNSIAVKDSVRVHENKLNNLSLFWVQAEQMRFGISPAILTIVVCISSIAASFAILNGVLPLILIGLPTAIFISSIIALAPMRIIFILAAITLLLDIMIFIFH